MANAPSKFQIKTGSPGSAQAGETLGANLLVKLDTTATPPTLVLNGVDETPSGSVQEPYASGDNAEYHKCLPGDTALLTGSGVIAVGNLVKGGASGVIVVETSPTTKTLQTVGKVLRNPATNLYEVEYQ